MPIRRNTGPKIATLRCSIEYKAAGDEVAQAEVRRERHIENMPAKGVSKRHVGILSRVIIRLKGGVRASTTKPLNKHVLYDIGRQFGNSRIFCFSHNNAVIGHSANVRRGDWNVKFKRAKKMFNFSRTYCDGYTWRRFGRRQSRKIPSSLRNLPVLRDRRPCVQHTKRPRYQRR